MASRKEIGKTKAKKLIQPVVAGQTISATQGDTTTESDGTPDGEGTQNLIGEQQAQAILDDVLDGTEKPLAQDVEVKPPALTGEIMSRFSDQKIVRLIYTGADPSRAITGPVPSRAKYVVRFGQLNVYGGDADAVLSMGNFREA